ncbi:hypothetical protein L5515_012693 [Caenorhabditis briggsae]|uniref:Uncharacterized protein n=1 Tax=Caenorhabditis briggsae TaxID=6238 RepID=A0AAE9JIQ7_CAEBR|nr:hypothetical protein L5515_012693 [Caenorhabditis briggsae]
MATPGSAMAKYLFRCVTHLRAQKKVTVTLQMLMDLNTPLALLEAFEIKKLVKMYREDKKHKELAQKVLLKIRAMKMEEMVDKKTSDAVTTFKIPRIPTHRIQKRVVA